MQFVACNHDAHANAILDIFNDAILHSTALYDYEPRALQSMDSWFKNKASGRFPVIGAIGYAGDLLGFATYGSFRDRPAYKYSVEHSVYVHRDRRGRGIGLALMRQLIATATDQQYHTVIGGIDASNPGSIALHEKLGFVHCGTIRQAGFKFGRWLDLAFYQLLLSTPAHPIDGNAFHAD
jgi:phosphinothricin acetyltransferase